MSLQSHARGTRSAGSPSLAWLTALVTPALLGWAFWVATGGHYGTCTH